MRWNDGRGQCRRWLLPLVAAGLVAGCQDDAVSPVAPPTHARFSVGAADSETLFRGIIFGQNYVSDAIPEIRDNLKVELLANSQFTATQMLDFQERLLTNVKMIDPDFLSRFKLAMNSGDHVRIGAVLDTAGAIVNNAMQYTVEGDSLAYYDANPSVVDSKMQPYLDPNGYFSLGDTLVTPSNASSELSNSNSSYYGDGGGGCEDPTQIICDSPSGLIYAYRAGVIVYYVGGVHVALVYNAYAFITAGRYVALWTPRHPFSQSTSLLRDEIINSIATNLRA
jgi:hypothetical protein